MPTFETPNPITATIDVAVGDVRIRADDGAHTTVDVRPSDPSSDDDVKVAKQTRVEYGGGRLLVKAPKLRSWRPRGTGGSVDVTIELPAGSELHANGQLTDFFADGRLGDSRVKTGIGQIRLDEAGVVSLKAGFGDIVVGRATGHAEVAAGSGDLRLRELGDSAVIKNSNGDTWIGSVGGDARLTAANGGIAVDAAGGSVVAKSATGDVRLGAVARGSVVLETGLGDVEVGIPEGIAAWLDVRSGTGRVHNQLEASQAPEASAETVEVRARTAAGNVLISRG
jgi:DUF4097 and DUF4098 domain-containing protein YvlB